jgi:hypothetical protein
MRWSCQRCRAGGTKRYSTATEARRYVTAFDREDRHDLGRPAPLVAGVPLRLGRAAILSPVQPSARRVLSSTEQ